MSPNYARKTQSSGKELRDKTELLRGTCHLTQKSFGAFKDKATSEISKNTDNIRKLRKVTHNTYGRLADRRNIDKTVIKDAVVSKRKELSFLENLSAEAAIGEMEAMVCFAMRYLNRLTYETERQEMILQSCKDGYRSINLLDTMLPEEEIMESNLTRLENDVDKANVKYDMAFTMTRCYKDIMEQLKEDSRLLPVRLQQLETTLYEFEQKYSKLKTMSKETRISRLQAKQQLDDMEDKTYEERSTRKAEMTETRRRVEDRKKAREKAEQRSARAVTLPERKEMQAQSLYQQQEKQRFMLSLDEVFQKILDAAHVPTIEEALENVETHEESHACLKEKLLEQDSQRNQQRETLAKLTTYFQNLKYTGEEKMSRGQRRMEELVEKIEKSVKNRDAMMHELRQYGDTLILIKSSVASLVERLTPIKLKSPEHSFTKGDVFDQLVMCSKKLEELMLELGDEFMSISAFSSIKDPEFQSFVSNRFEHLLGLNTYISKTGLMPSMQTLHRRFSDEPNEILTRADIKHLGQRLIDASNKKQKAKKNEKKKHTG